jgi:hypothetical protein
MVVHRGDVDSINKFVIESILAEDLLQHSVLCFFFFSFILRRFLNCMGRPCFLGPIATAYSQPSIFLGKNLNTHSFYSVEEFLTFKNDS